MGFPDVIGYLGRLLFVLGAILFLPIFVSLIYFETNILTTFLLPAVSCLFIGFLITKRVKLRKIRKKDAMLITTLGWLLAAGIGAFPYFTILKISYLDAFFEAMSGFTTTNMTLLANVERYPHGLLFWRALTQWLGGAGILLFFLAMVMRPGMDAALLYTAETHKIGTRRLKPGIVSTVRTIWTIYAGLTLTLFIVLVLEGGSVFHALCHALTAVSTGGFSTFNNSIAGFNSPLIEYTIIVFMLAGGINFLVHYRVFGGDIKEFLRNPEVKALWFILFGATAAIFFDLLYHMNLSSIRLALFHVSSILTTTGYTTVQIIAWPPLSKTLLMLLMVIGGGVCSTAGAVKILRVLILAKLGYREVLRSILPRRQVVRIKIGDTVVGDEEVLRVAGFFALYLTILVIGGLITISYGYGGLEGMSAMFSAMGNVGPCYINLLTLPATLKLLYVLGMLAGRLELLPVVFIFFPAAWR